VSISKFWVRLNDEVVVRLTGGVAEAIGLPALASIRLQMGVSPLELWQQVADGSYLPFRVRRG